MQNMKESAEIKARLQAGNICYCRLTKLLKTGMLSKNLKVQKYCTLIEASHNMWMWNVDITQIRKNKLLIFDWKILRRIFGPYQDEGTGEWRIRKKLRNKTAVSNARYTWGQLERDIFNGPAMLGEMKELWHV